VFNFFVPPALPVAIDVKAFQALKGVFGNLEGITDPKRNARQLNVGNRRLIHLARMIN